MDLDGIEKLMREQHRSILSRLDSLDSRFTQQQSFCDGRFDVIEDDVKKHDRCIQKSKGIITIIGSIWAAATTIAALVAPYFWR
jgi:hypothetical protein